MSKAIFASFKMFVRSVFSDGMLLFMTILPIFLAGLFRHIIPLMVSYFDWTFLPHFYILFDLFLSTIAPTLWGFAAAMVILDEMDLGISRQIMVSPAGKFGYLFSRIGFPTLIAFPFTVALLYFAHLSESSISILLAMSFLSTISSLVTSVMIVSIAHNRVEGMAIGKLSSLLTLGMFAPYFISSWQQFIFGFLPTFWLSRFVLSPSIISFIATLITTYLMTFTLVRRFIKRLW